VVSIGNRAFGECYALARVTVGRGVTTIGDYAFANCSALRTVDFLGDPPTIGSNAFYGVSASAYSSASNSMWTESATQDYGGALSWGTKAMVQIISQPKTQTAYTDTQVSFSVAAAGDIAGYRWQYSKDGGKSWYSSSSATQGYNTATLTVNVTLARNGFKYRCRITDTNGGYHYSSAATLNAKQAYVFIDTQPVSRTVTEGDTVVFRVVASGQVAAYRWQYTTNGGASWNNSSSATQGYNTPTLSVNATLARNGFMYRCRITDHDGNYYYSDPATLTVKKLSLTFTQQPASTTVKQGSKACFTVAVEETGVTYRWQYSTNGTYWTNSTVYTEGYDQPTLYVTGAAKRDGFLYRCRITDSNGNRFYSDVAALWVNVPQQSAFATQPKDQYVMAGGKAVFSVTTVGEIASIQWQYQVKEGDAWYNSTANTQGYNTDTLTVSATNARNNFGYRCVITDADGYVHTSQEVRLHITKAQIDIQPQDQTVALGENAVFCAGTSGQTQKVYWQYSKDGGKSWYNSSSSFPGYDSLAMTVAATQARNGFMYRCVVIDADGNRINSEPAKLTVKEPYPAVGVAYKLGLFQNNIGQDFFFTGSTESASVNYRLELGGWGYAVDVYLEEAEDGYRLYFWNGGVKTYIRVFHYKDGNVGYGKGSLELTTSVPAEVYRYDAQANTLIYDHSSGNSYYMGTYSQYETVSVSNVYYITGSNAANVDKTQFPVRLYPQDHLD